MMGLLSRALRNARRIFGFVKMRIFLFRLKMSHWSGFRICGTSVGVAVIWGY